MSEKAFQTIRDALNRCVEMAETTYELYGVRDACGEAEHDFSPAFAALKTLTDEHAAMIGALGEPCAECGHIDWRADPNEYLDRMEAAEKWKADSLAVFRAIAFLGGEHVSEEDCVRLFAIARGIAFLGMDENGIPRQKIAVLASESRG